MSSGQSRSISSGTFKESTELWPTNCVVVDDACGGAGQAEYLGMWSAG